MFNHDVQSVVDLTALEPGLAGVLLLHVNFNRDMTNTDFFDPRKGAKLRDDAGLESKCPSTVDPDPDIDFSCELCMEDVDFGETFALSCKHRFCKSCFAEHIDAAERNSVFRRCPKGECGLAIGAPAAQQVLPPEQYTKYMNWILERFVTASNRLKYCPTPGCGAVVVNSDLATYPEVTCGSCVKRWCFNCTEEPHRPANCDQVLAWKEKGDDSDLTALWIKANTKKCPRCNKVINKDAGCQHMTCDRCKHQFCWLCMRPYSEHSEETGGFYACHKFEMRVKEEGKSEEEKEALRAQRTLRNYNMAVERHLAHKQACSNAETDLLETANRNAERLSAQGFVAGSFLTDAVTTIVRCRRVLAWSYVYKYYKFDDGGMERELNLFEDYQGRLEHLTRKLHDMVARDVSKFLPDTKRSRKHKHGSGRSSSSGAGSGAGAGAGSAAGIADGSFGAFREQVQRYANALRRFLSSVLDFEQTSKDFKGVEWVARVEDTGKKKRAVWEWQDTSGVWNAFSDELTQRMEEALRVGESVIDVHDNHRKYRLDLIANIRTTSGSRASTPIRRVVVEGSDWSCPGCTFHNRATAKQCAVCNTARA